MNPTDAIDPVVEQITIDAPAERVFEALVDPEQRLQWWGRGRFRALHAESDLRPGGKWLMRLDAGGREASVRGEYRTIERPNVLSFTWLPDWSPEATETLVRFDLSERDGITTVRLTHSGFASQADRDSHRGWPDILSWLRDHVEQTA